MLSFTSSVIIGTLAPNIEPFLKSPVNKVRLTNLSPLRQDGRVERRQQVHSVRTKEEVVIIHDGEPVSVVDGADGVIERHGLDVE